MERPRGRTNRGRKYLKRRREESDEDDQLLAASGVEISGMSAEEKQQITKVLRLSNQATDDSENDSSVQTDDNSAAGQSKNSEVTADIHADAEQREVTVEVHVDVGEESDDTRPPSPDSPMFSPQHAGGKEKDLNEEPWKKASMEFIDLNKTSDEIADNMDDVAGGECSKKPNHVHNKEKAESDDYDDIFILSDRSIKRNVTHKSNNTVSEQKRRRNSVSDETDEVMNVDDGDDDTSGSEQWHNKSDKMKSSHRDNDKRDRIIDTKVASVEEDGGNSRSKEKPNGKGTNKIIKKSLNSNKKAAFKTCDTVRDNATLELNGDDDEPLSHSAVLPETDHRLADAKSDDDEEEDNEDQSKEYASNDYSAPPVLLTRKKRLKLVQKHPYFSLSPSRCHDYTPVLVRLLKRYHHQVIKAQRHSVRNIAWGDSIKVGRHCSRTIDFKRRRGDSFCIDPDEDDGDDISDEFINDTADNKIKCGSDERVRTAKETKQRDIEPDEKILSLKSRARLKYAVVNPCDKDDKSILQEKYISRASPAECDKYSIKNSDSPSGENKKSVNSSSPEPAAHPDTFLDIIPLEITEETDVSNSALDRLGKTNFDAISRLESDTTGMDMFLDNNIPVSSKILRSHQNKLNSGPVISSTNRGPSASKSLGFRKTKNIAKISTDNVKQCVLDMLERESQDSVNSIHPNKNYNNIRASRTNVESMLSDKQPIPGSVSNLNADDNSEGFIPVNDDIFERAGSSSTFTCSKERCLIQNSPDRDDASGDECSEIDIFSSQNTDYDQSKTTKRLKLNICGNNTYLKKSKTNSKKISFEQLTGSSDINSGSSPKRLFSDFLPVGDDHAAFTRYPAGRQEEESSLLVDEDVLPNNVSDNYSAKYRENRDTSISPIIVGESGKENTSRVSKVANTILQSFKKLRSKTTGKQTLSRESSHDSQSTSGSQNLINASSSCSVQSNMTRNKRSLQTRKVQNRVSKQSVMMGLNINDADDGEEAHISSVESLASLDQDTQQGCGVLCPLCNEEFSQDKIEQHASACLGPPFETVEEPASHSHNSHLLEKSPDDQMLLSNDDDGSTKTCFICDEVVDVELFNEHMNQCIAASTKRQQQMDTESVGDKEDVDDAKIHLRNRRNVHSLFSDVKESASRLQRQQPPRRKRAKCLTVDSPSDSSGTDFL